MSSRTAAASLAVIEAQLAVAEARRALDAARINAVFVRLEKRYGIVPPAAQPNPTPTVLPFTAVVPKNSRAAVSSTPTLRTMTR